MKKAKLMIVGLALFTTVGAALAFTANKNGNLFCTSVQGAACATIAPGVFESFVQNPNGQLSYCSTVNTDCPKITDDQRIQVVQQDR